MKEIIHLGVKGRGENLREAKKDAESKIAAFMAENLSPTIIRHPKYQTFAGVVFPFGPGQWGYYCFNTDDPNLEGTTPCGTVLCAQNREQAIKECRKSLGQRVFCWSSKVWDDENIGLEFITEKQDRKNHILYIAWQRDYDWLRRHEGKTDQEAHRLAQSECRHVANLLARETPTEAAA